MRPEELARMLPKMALPIVSIRRSVVATGPLLGRPNVEIRCGQEHAASHPVPLNKILDEAGRTSPRLRDRAVTVVHGALPGTLEQLDWLIRGLRSLFAEIHLETDGEGLLGRSRLICGCTAIVVTPRQFAADGMPLDLDQIVSLARHENVHHRFLIDGPRSFDYLCRMSRLLLLKGRNPLLLTPTGHVTLTSVREALEGHPLPNILLLPESRIYV